MSGVLVAMGDLLEDLRVRPETEIRPATDTPSHIERHLGGSAAQVALAAARDGTAAAFIGNVGRDAAGDRLLDNLRLAGVTTHVTRSGRTGTVVALLAPDGERTMLTDRGSASDLDSIEPGWLHEVAVLHLPAYSVMERSLATTSLAAAATARERGALISVDVCSVGAIDDFGPTTFVELLKTLSPDVLFANRAEGEMLSGHTRVSELADMVIVKQGGAPAYVHHASGLAEVAVPEMLELADSTGAGDAFAAGFLGGIIRGVGPSAAALRGHEVAARTLRDR